MVSSALATVTPTAADTPVCPAASPALAVSVCGPFATRVVSHGTSYGALVSVPITVPSTENVTPVTPTSSEAVASTAIGPLTLAPSPGAVMPTVGAVVSGGGAVVTTSWGRLVAVVPSRETNATPSADVEEIRIEKVPSPVTIGPTLNCAHVLRAALPIAATGSESAAGAVFHVTFSGQVCEATRATDPPTGDGLVTNSRNVAPTTTSDPTPETVNRRSPFWTGELSAVKVPSDP